MPRPRITNGLLVIVLLAGVGFLLIYVPGKVVELYDRVKALGAPSSISIGGWWAPAR